MADSNSNMKWCPSCQRDLSHSDFGKNAKRYDGLQGWCKECVRANHAVNRGRYLAQRKQHRTENRDAWLAQRREHYQKNKGKILAEAKQYRDAHKEQLSEYFRAYHKAHKEVRQDRAREHYQRNRDRHLALAKAWRNNNKEGMREYHKRYDKEHPETHRTAKRNYKARKKQAQGSFTKQQWLDKCCFHGWRCIYCRASLTPETVHAEHRKPLSRGGSNWIANVAPACVPCNLSKNNKSESEYRQTL
jgi:hypothetical protein